MRNFLIFAVTLFAITLVPELALAEGVDGGGLGTLGLGIGAGLAIGMAGLGCGIGQGLAGGGAAQGIARNPGAAGTIQTAMIISLALIESIALYGLVLGILLWLQVGTLVTAIVEAAN